MTEYITYNTDDVIVKTGSIDDVRASIDESKAGEENLVTVFVKVWRDSRLKKAKHCIESLLKYNRDVKFKLALVNNGGSQNVTDYFESIDYDDKQIIHITKNISACFSGGIAQRLTRTKYMVELLNDNIVTSHWLANMLMCLEKDPKIGMACPLCTNTPSRQEPPFKGKCVEELLKIAETYNKSDLSKWEERLVLIPQGAVIRRAVFDAAGIYDKGYLHEAADDDLALRIRRAGYKLILCKDTFIIHDHDYNSEKAAPKNLNLGFAGYKEKFKGIDIGIDIQNSIVEWIKDVDFKVKDRCDVLGIDCRCGTPILDIKNKYHQVGNKNIVCDAFTTNPLYYEDLQSICTNVYCDSDALRIGRYIKRRFDFIVIDKPLNEYNEPFELIDFAVCHAKSYVLFKIKNFVDIGMLLKCLGGNNPARIRGFKYLDKSDIDECLEKYNYADVKVMRENSVTLQEKVKETLNKINLDGLYSADRDGLEMNLSTFRYWYLIKIVDA